MYLAKMTGHWLGEAKTLRGPFKPLVESSNLSALTSLHQPSLLTAFLLAGVPIDGMFRVASENYYEVN